LLLSPSSMFKIPCLLIETYVFVGNKHCDNFSVAPSEINEKL
jgi:hypothetical protein